LEAGWEILTETTGSDTKRSREIAALIAKHYESDPGGEVAERWLARANGTEEQ
jgi:hypothetical protein